MNDNRFEPVAREVIGLEAMARISQAASTKRIADALDELVSAANRIAANMEPLIVGHAADDQ